MTIEQVWPEWQVDRLIGKGSYGAVYRCMKAGDKGKEYAAVKVISVPQDDFEADSIVSEGMTGEQSREYYKDITDNFINEIKILEALKDEKHIVNIQDSKVVEKEDGIGWQIFIRMELLTDFNTYASDKVLSADEVKKLALDLCDALIVCGKKRIVHRDIKPENIFVDAEGNFKLGDFGVAKQLEKTYASMSTKGTYNYMAPEVVASKKYDSRADIYSLGMVMYKLLNNNRLPFLDPDKQLIRFNERQEAFERRIKGERIPPIPNIDDDLNEAILKACEFRPDERYRTVEEFRDALTREKPSSRFVRIVKRHKVVSAIVFLLVVSIVSGSCGSVLSAIKAHNAYHKFAYPEKSFVLGVNKKVVSLNNIGIVSDINGVQAVFEETGEKVELSDREGTNIAFDGKWVCYNYLNDENKKNEIVIQDLETKQQLILVDSKHVIAPVYFDESDLYFLEYLNGGVEMNCYSFETGNVTEIKYISDGNELNIDWYSFELVDNHPIIVYKALEGNTYFEEILCDKKELLVHRWLDEDCVFLCSDNKYFYYTKTYVSDENNVDDYIAGKTEVYKFCIGKDSIESVKANNSPYFEIKESFEQYNNSNNSFKNGNLITINDQEQNYITCFDVFTKQTCVFGYPYEYADDVYPIFYPVGYGVFGYAIYEHGNKDEEDEEYAENEESLEDEDYVEDEEYVEGEDYVEDVEYEEDEEDEDKRRFINYEIGYILSCSQAEIKSFRKKNMLDEKSSLLSKMVPICINSIHVLMLINKNGFYCLNDAGTVVFHQVDVRVT